MEYDSSFSYVGHMEGEEYTYFWRGWKVNSWVEAFLPSDFVRMGKMLRVSLPSCLFLTCLIFVPSLLFRFFLCCLLAHCLCALFLFFFLTFFNFNEVYYLSKKFIMVSKQEVLVSNPVSILNPIYRIPMCLAPI